MRKLLILFILLLAFPGSAQEVTDEPFPPEGWIEVVGDQFNLLGSEARTTAMHTMMQPVYDLMAANTRTQPTIKLLIVGDGLLPGCETDESGTAVIIVEETPEPCSAETVDLGGYEPLIPAAGRRVEDELTRALFERFYPSEPFPAWFAAGLVDFYAPTPKLDLLSQVRDAARSNQLFTLAEMARSSADPLWRLQSYGMILYILDQIGVGELFTLAEDADSFSTAYQQRLGEPLTALIPNWQNWIFTRAAELTYGVTPYQAPTITPTASNTPTQTAVPSLTPTPVPSLMATVLLTPTASRAPTRTASQIPTVYPLVTVTPRPPGSPLMIATETPVPAAPFQLPRISIVAVLIILLVILVLVYVALSYRK